MADFVTTHRLTHKASLKMIQAGVAKAEMLGCKVSLAVVDQSCRLIAFVMMDGARHFSIITTQRKAITAASQRLPTGYAPEENALSMSVRMGDFSNVPGGFPIEVDGEVIYGPEIITRGFVYVRDNEELIKRAQEIVQDLIKKRVPAKVLETKIKDALTNFTAREIGRRPMILPLVMEV